MPQSYDLIFVKINNLINYFFKEISTKMKLIAADIYKKQQKLLYPFCRFFTISYFTTLIFSR